VPTEEPPAPFPNDAAVEAKLCSSRSACKSLVRESTSSMSLTERGLLEPGEPRGVEGGVEGGECVGT
jgi:hypothetical protein